MATSPMMGNEVLSTLTGKERSRLQRQIVMAHYKKFTDPVEKQEYKSLITKVSLSTLGILMVVPYVGYHLLTSQQNFTPKKNMIMTGLGCQVVLTYLNYKWGKQFRNMSERLQNKYLDHLSDYHIINFDSLCRQG